LRPINWFLSFLKDSINWSQDGEGPQDFRNWVFEDEDELTWTNHLTRERLKFLLNPKMQVLEFGSGQSTHFFLSRGALLDSIEDDLDWYKTMKEELGDLEELSIQWIASEFEKEEVDPAYSCQHGLPSKGRSWKSYAMGAEAFPDAYFDLILIAGRARMACMKHSIPKLKKGGILVIDHADRIDYQEDLNTFLRNWRFESFQGERFGSPELVEARIYFKPIS